MQWCVLTTTDGASAENIMMVEGEMKEVSEQELD